MPSHPPPSLAGLTSTPEPAPVRWQGPSFVLIMAGQGHTGAHGNPILLSARCSIPHPHLRDSADLPCRTVLEPIKASLAGLARGASGDVGRLAKTAVHLINSLLHQ